MILSNGDIYLVSQTSWWRWWCISRNSSSRVKRKMATRWSPQDSRHCEDNRPQEVFQSTLRGILIDRKRSSWRKLIRITAYVFKFVRKLCSKTQKTEEPLEQLDNNVVCLSPRELKEAERYWIKDAQKEFYSRIKKGELTTWSPFTDTEGVIRVGGRADKATVSYESKHPALLLYDTWISLLNFHITRFPLLLSGNRSNS